MAALAVSAIADQDWIDAILTGKVDVVHLKKRPEKPVVAYAWLGEMWTSSLDFENILT